MLRIRLFLLTLVVAVGGLAPATASARTGALPDPTYEGIVTMLESLEELEDSTATPKKQLAAVRAVCAAIPKTDELLKSQRAICDETVVLARATLGNCSTVRSCIRTFERSGASAKRLNTLSVSQNEIIDRTVPAGACRTTLRASPKDLRNGKAVVKAFSDIVRALRTDNEKLFGQATKRLARALSADAGTTADQITAITTHC